jgi:NitT/TauT family transport system ATP-binding protein
MTGAAGLGSVPDKVGAAIVAAVDLKGVTRSYKGRDGGAVHALGPVDLRIEPGSFVCVVGPSGCGKSTLLRLVAGLEMPDEGSMFRYGGPLDGPSHEVGIVFQEHVLFPWITVLENVLLPAEVLALPKASSRERALRLLKMTGLEDFANLRPHMLSGGMKQRAAFCRAMLSDPRLLLLDEPFGALDRILIMSERPGRIRADITVDLPRPRNADTAKLPRFQELKHRVRDIIFNRAQA